MVNSINANTPLPQAGAVSSGAVASPKGQTPNQSSAPAYTDTVRLSSTAQAQLSAAQSALQESTETAAQTLKEALAGDMEAYRLLAREAQAAQAARFGE